ncbi:LuxR C-terminal-related transcriptional regulator [Paraburkholderia sp.]|uniref:helix-turn-helix transcriptional regulator n=1 Tax=Paraburkholderia sp. TaxID=1926495 RepID=UPI002395C9A9|nr:LuxR C-terminal-related transcriptional regulator [Paraburkholderia sp.]MDE1180442.1 LuxR C-terminal-related transcriptional regulator [Paraburkholderia sp.]
MKPITAELAAPLPLDGATVSALLDLARGGPFDAIRDRCFDRLSEWFREPALGLYLLDGGGAPLSRHTRDVPDGFLDEYEASVRRRDPVLRYLLRAQCVVAGESLFGANWRRSTVGTHLLRWGFAHNMQGPLVVGGTVIGTLNVAVSGDREAFSVANVERFGWVCRAVSVALDSGAVSAQHAERAAVRDRDDAIAQLPPRAAAVARLICTGASNKAIARALDISEYTVKDHVQGLCRRFGVHNRTSLCAHLTGRSTPSFGGIEALKVAH